MRGRSHRRAAPLVKCSSARFTDVARVISRLRSVQGSYVLDSYPHSLHLTCTSQLVCEPCTVGRSSAPSWQNHVRARVHLAAHPAAENAVDEGSVGQLGRWFG